MIRYIIDGIIAMLIMLTGCSGAGKTETNLESEVKSKPLLVIECNDKVFYAEFEDNSSADDFAAKLGPDGIDVDMHDYGSFEKVGPLPWSVERNDESITTEPGDVILYQGNQITIYYDENSWNFTRLAKIKDVSQKELMDALGDGNVTVHFSLEYSS